METWKKTLHWNAFKVDAGFMDHWQLHSGTEFMAVEGQPNFFPGTNSLPMAGSAVARVERTGDQVTLLWDGQVLHVTTVNSIPVTEVMISFWYFEGAPHRYQYPFHIGTLAMDRVSFEGEILAPPNDPPTAVPGPDTSVRAGDLVTLDGSGSFDDNTASGALLYDWVLDAPIDSNATLSGATTIMPSFVADIEGTYVATLIVTDEGELASVPAQVTVSSDNLAPIARIVADTLVLTGTSVSLDGSQSTDPENDPLTYSWTIGVPAGSGSVPTDPSAEITSFSPDLDGTYDVVLVVSDLIGPSDPLVLSIVSTDAGTFAEAKIVNASNVIASLPGSAVTTVGNQNALQNFLAQAISELQNGNIQEAIDKIEKAILRTDGCALNGEPDGNGPSRDWILDCAAQMEIYTLLTDALDAIDP